GRNVRKSQARRQIRRRAAIRDLCSLKAALLSRRENLRKKTTISDIVIQRAGGGGHCNKIGRFRTGAARWGQRAPPPPTTNFHNENCCRVAAGLGGENFNSRVAKTKFATMRRVTYFSVPALWEVVRGASGRSPCK